MSTFFGVQIAIRSPRGEPWRARLVELLRSNQGDQSMLEKRALYTRLSNLLEEAKDRWALGTWDLFRGTQGDSAFDEWVAGLEATVNEPLDPSSAAGDHVVVTFVFLVEAGSRSDETLGERCDVPESQFFKRATFARLVATLRMLAFPSVLADGLYAAPGDVDAGHTLADLRGEGWDYLKPLT